VLDSANWVKVILDKKSAVSNRFLLQGLPFKIPAKSNRRECSKTYWMRKKLIEFYHYKHISAVIFQPSQRGLLLSVFEGFEESVLTPFVLFDEQHCHLMSPVGSIQ